MEPSLALRCCVSWHNNYNVHDKIYIKLPDRNELITAKVVETHKEAHDVAKNTIKLSNYESVTYTPRIELQNTVKKYYGDNFDSFTYLDKFFDYKFSLPSPDIKNYLNFIEEPLSSSYVDDHILYIIEHFNLSMRNINHFLSTYKIVSYSFNNSQGISDEPGLLFCQECIIPILVYLFLFDKAKYISFMQGNEDTFFAELINNKKKDKYADDFLNLAKNKSSPDPKDIGTLKVMYKKLFSKEKYYNFYDNSKYQFPNWIKDKIEKSMSCFF